jgi:hypothetical protein
MRFPHGYTSTLAALQSIRVAIFGFNCAKYQRPLLQADVSGGIERQKSPELGRRKRYQKIQISRGSFAIISAFIAP